MTDIIIFESADELIVCDVSTVNRTIEEWFLKGGRSLDNFETHLVKSGDAAAFSTRFVADNVNNHDHDVIELMPDVLREALIKAELLTDE